MNLIEVTKTITARWPDHKENVELYKEVVPWILLMHELGIPSIEMASILTGIIIGTFAAYEGNVPTSWVAEWESIQLEHGHDS